MKFYLLANTINIINILNIINIFILITVLIVCINCFAICSKKFIKCFSIITSILVVGFNFFQIITQHIKNEEIKTIQTNNSIKSLSEYNLNFVAHASGSIDNINYLNCQESFIKSIEKGFKYIELDFVTSSDGEVFCAHSFEHYENFSFENKPTIAEVKSTKLYGKYTPITLDWLFEKLKENPDIKIIYDTKEENADDEIEILKKIITASERENFNIKDKFIIQVYSINNYLHANKLKFNEYWFSNYKAEYNSNIIEYFEQRENVTTLVLNYNTSLCKNYINAIYNTNKKLAVYTVNDSNLWQNLEDKNVDFVYIDFY